MGRSDRQGETKATWQARAIPARATVPVQGSFGDGAKVGHPWHRHPCFSGEIGAAVVATRTARSGASAVGLRPCGAHGRAMGEHFAPTDKPPARVMLGSRLVGRRFVSAISDVSSKTQACKDATALSAFDLRGFRRSKPIRLSPLEYLAIIPTPASVRKARKSTGALVQMGPCANQAFSIS